MRRPMSYLTKTRPRKKKVLTDPVSKKKKIGAKSRVTER
jgi:hypothetical protein